MDSLDDFMKEMNRCVKSAYNELAQYQGKGLVTSESVAAIAIAMFREYCAAKLQKRQHDHELEVMRWARRPTETSAEPKDPEPWWKSWFRKGTQ